ncbi:DUF3152 domain-containing protein [Nocardioides sp. zg-ZUI104]|uniref:DUF3152 domain-containing protein n=1 Tax=Nocardioides faecalis TaxID=2803858 RepID=UPI001BCDAEE6|nr:DUF3152 domain-containing protein [Nocardioides faecalis]MBS4752735.1 DUF3152 domain-containing protein [Nocardioides faecalis]
MRPRRLLAALAALTGLLVLAALLPGAPAVADRGSVSGSGGGSGLVAGGVDETAPATLPAMRLVRAPSYAGVRRYDRLLRVGTGTWRPAPTSVRYQWRRDGTPIPGAHKRRYRSTPADVGRRISVAVTAAAPGHRPRTTVVRIGRIAHAVPVRRTVTYSVRTRGAVPGGLRQFKRQAQATLDDARGWRARGVRFQRVRSGGTFTLWLVEARLVPSFSSVCSTQWSCRVGRNVIINLDRWRHASPAWNAAGRSLREYRHMVVNHETGHWIGFGHASCPAPGALAPVMMQQSKGRGGCRFNPWPTPAELRRR